MGAHTIQDVETQLDAVETWLIVRLKADDPYFPGELRVAKFMTNNFLGSESMDHQLLNALSTMFLRHLVMFLHFETYALANPQKAVLSGNSGPQLDFLPQLYLI